MMQIGTVNKGTLGSWESIVVPKDQLVNAVRHLDDDPNVVRRHVMG